MKGKSEREVTQSCPTLRDPMDCSPPGSFVRGVFQARTLEQVSIVFSGEQPMGSQELATTERLNNKSEV